MKDPEQLTEAGDADETLVTPRFDEEETVLAQPVVPLAAVEGDAAVTGAAPPPPYVYDSPAQPYAPRYAAPRRSWILALALASALVGSVLGIGGFYLYQKSERRQAPAVEEQSSEPPDAAQPSPQPTAEAPGESAALSPEPEVEPEVEDEPAVTPTAVAAEVEAREAPKPSTESRPAERRVADDREEERPVTLKRGKKGERDPEPRDDDDDDRASARRVDSIVYPTRREEREARRAERRARRQQRREQSRVVDRVRGIFEGQPW